MPNPSGTIANLRPAPPGNQRRLVHGAYSTRRELSAEGEALVAELLAAPHVIPADRLAVEELASLVDLIARIDAALADGRVENRRGEARSLIDLRRRLSGQLERWLRELGLTPAARAEWAARLGGQSLGAEIARLRAERGAP